MLRDLLRVSLRGLRRSPGYAAIVISSLAAGFALTAMVFVVVNAYVVGALPYADAPRLYHVMYAPPGPQEPRGMADMPWAKLNDVVEYAVTASGDTYYLTGDGPAQSIRGLHVSQGFIAGLGVRASLGRTLVATDFDASAETPALIGQSLWRDRFGGDSTIIGRRIAADAESRTGAREAFRVVGVLPPGFWFGRDSRDRIDLVAPLLTPARTYMVRLRTGITSAMAEQRLTAAARTVGSAFPRDWPGVRLEGVHDRYVSGLRATLLSVIVAAAIVLFVTWANVAALTLLRTIRRERELAIRVALGATGAWIFTAVFVDVAIVCVGATVAGLAAASLALRASAPAIAAQLGKPSPAGPQVIAIGPAALAGAVGLALLVALALAALAVFPRRTRRVGDALRGSGRAVTDAPAARRLRGMFVSLEIAGAFALLVGGTLMVKSVAGMFSTRLGYRIDGLVRTRIVLRAASYPDRESYERFYETLTTRLGPLSHLPAAFTSWPPFYEAPPQAVTTEDGGSSASAMVTAVSPGYFTTLGIGVVDGRSFGTADRSSADAVAIVSRSLAQRLWPGANPLGRSLRVTESTGDGPVMRQARTVVGVVNDVRQSYTDSDLRDLYVPYAQSELGRFGTFYLATDRAPPLVARQIREVVSSIDPLAVANDPVPVSAENTSLARAKFMTSMLGGLAAFSLLVVLLGVYGVIAYAVQQREREVAIRVALGATGRSIQGLFVKDGVRMVAAGIAIGSVGAFAVGRTLEHQLIGVRPFDAFTFGLSVAVMVTTGLSAVWWPARRASTAPPMRVLNDP